MRIVDSKVAMSSRQELSQTYSRTESLRAWIGPDPRDQRRAGDRLQLSAEARQLMQAAPQPENDPVKDDPLAALDPQDRIRVLILQALLGVDVRVAVKLPDKEGATSGEAPPPEARREGWGVDYRLHERYEETEKLTFAAHGVIQTADGQRIAFAVELGLSRRFVQESNLHIRAGDALRPVDPLVINYGGAAAELTERRFRFDLEVGGHLEEMPLLKAGSGFLTLDGNGDGQVNDGSELFGPATGDGFAELARHDVDGNHWIDAADPIFERLRVWTRDAAGRDQLFALGRLGIGAIFVGSVDAGFTLTGAGNQPLGINRKAGLYMRENGTAGTVQQLDIMA
ncbi:MAG TPA: hypothetical protein VD969_23640 [Symbiobacteriaceae bacterium]|nr:hypothetical protein [Symbiobacteriaceae bacterium]